MPAHLKPGGHCCGGGAGQHLGRAAVGEHVKAEWRLECCDNREFIVSVLSLLSNVILTSERAQICSSRVLSPALATNLAVAVVQFVVQSPGDADVAFQTGLENINSLACSCSCLGREAEAVR